MTSIPATSPGSRLRGQYDDATRRPAWRWSATCGRSAPAGRGAGAAGNPAAGQARGVPTTDSMPRQQPAGDADRCRRRDVSASTGNQVLAIEAHTGKEVWRYLMPLGMATTARGVAYWPGDGRLAPRILLTAGPRLVALDAATGMPARGFGRNGIVEIAVPWNGVPTIYRNIAILGATTGEVALSVPGDTRAFDIRTGKHLWDFHTVPLPGELGHETWLDHGWRNRSGVERVGVVHDARRRARNPLHAGRGSGRQLLGRRSTGQQPLRQLDRRGQRRDRQVSLALPDGSPRSLGCGHAQSARSRGRRSERPPHSGARIGRQDRLHVHPRSRDRETDLRRRRTAGAERQRTRRVVLADATISDQAGASALARRIQQRARHGSTRRHVGATCRRVPGAVGQERRLRQRRGRSRRSAFTRRASRRRARSSSPAAPEA